MSAYAASSERYVLQLDDELKSVSFSKCGQLLTMSEQDTLGWQQIMSIPSQKFALGQEFDVNKSVQWIKIELENTSDTTLRYFQFLYHNTDYVDSYLINDQKKLVEHVKSGAMVKLGDRPFQEFEWSNIIIPTPIPVGKHTLLLKVKNVRKLTREHLRIRKLSLIGGKRFWSDFSKSDFIDGMLLVYFVVLALLSFLLFLADRVTIYLQTSLLILFSSLFAFVDGGHFIHLFTPDLPQWSIYVQYVYGMVYIMIMLWVSASYLRTGSFAPRLVKIMYILIGLNLIVSPLALGYKVMYDVWMILVLGVISFLMVLMGLGIRARVRQSYFYAVGLSFLMVLFTYGYFVSYFDLFEMEPTSRYYLTQLAIAIFITSLLLGLIDRYVQVKKKQHEKQLQNERAINQAEMEKRILIEDQNLLLEQKVRERTEEIEEKNKQLEKLDKMKSRFFSNISHEFRTPLTLIQGPAKDLQKRLNGDSRSRHELDTILANANQLLDLINQLLDLAKAENDVIDLNLESVEISAFVSNQVRPFLSLAETKRIHIQMSGVSEFLCMMDVRKMQRVFDNILFNALKFSPDDSDITIKAYQEETNCVLEIIDKGKGIPDASKEKIFERFYQIDTSDTAQGSGIGLALAKVYTTMHGGTIRVQNNIPVGSRFVVEIPIGKVDTLPHEALNHGISRTTASQHNGIEELQQTPDESKQKVLVIEDDQGLRQYIRSCFEQGYEVYEAANGLDGLNLAKKIVPDAIVSDIMMPKMDGTSMTRQLKEQMLTSHIPILLLTAKASLDNKVDGLSTGADDYLTKPFESEELVARISSLISNRQKLFGNYRQGITTSDLPSLPDIEQQFVDMVKQEVRQKMEDQRYDVSALSEALKMNRTTLFRKVKAVTGQTPTLFIRSIRLEEASRLLQDGGLNINEIAHKVGFSSTSYFSKSFKECYGVSPSERLV
ncbi:MAG: response regulator [Reichenbachiella sp.]|uniref:response regulator n=1 Tax=Reichenbachiella sp. TaxID=2184521 RepID=UPI0032973F34